MIFQLYINDTQAEISSSAELRKALELAAHQQYREMCVSADNGPALSALCNGRIGWLMFLRKSGDAGFSSRNPDYEGDPEAMIEYRLSNGQRDFYPAGWALPEGELLEALEFFVKHGDRPPSVLWHDDSK